MGGQDGGLWWVWLEYVVELATQASLGVFDWILPPTSVFTES